MKIFGRMVMLSAVAAVVAAGWLGCVVDNGAGPSGGTAPRITTATLPGGTAGTAYSQAIMATGDTPITWSLVSGALPMGLSLFENGIVSGTPIAAGTSNFSVKASNSAGNDTKSLSITITGGSTTPTTPTTPTAYSLDGIWESDHGIVISIYAGKAVFTNIDVDAGWREVEKKGNIKIGDSYYRNISKTGDLTWSLQCQTYNTSTYELLDWRSGTITLSPNGQKFDADVINIRTFTRKTVYDIDGVWESDHGIIISIYDGKAVFTNIDVDAGWREVEKRGNIKIGDSYYRNIRKTGDLTWSLQCQTYNTSTYELLDWRSGTITLSPNGQKFDANVINIRTFTRYQ
jgi:hypothetical protein